MRNAVAWIVVHSAVQIVGFAEQNVAACADLAPIAVETRLTVHSFEQWSGSALLD